MSEQFLDSMEVLIAYQTHELKVEELVAELKDERLVQIVPPAQLCQILRQQGKSFLRPAFLLPGDDWDIGTEEEL